MFQMHPLIISQMAADKRRDILAQAEQDRLASQIAAMARASRRAERAERRLQKASRRAVRLRAELNQ